jgi:predicted TIM-barrel fold metal-dependent hydrolase
MSAGPATRPSISRWRQIWDALGHPVIDADGHTIDLLPVLTDVLRTPAEAIAELEFAVGELGLKAVNLGGSPSRRIRKLMDELPDAAPYATRPEVFGIDSDYDYDPVWAKCEELGVAPCFHSELISPGDFRAFSFENAVRLHGGMNPSFFDGSSFEPEARAVLSEMGRPTAKRHRIPS